MVKLKNPRRERILNRYLEEEMRESFIDYSMSVIVQRALPDARDGLKPAQRRILYAMHELGLGPERGYKKSATVVGDVLGKYHPHGDVTVYETLVRMAQDFSMRYPLIDGQGNFGSIDGDPAAAYRYTEARLAPIATDLLRDIERETVDFKPNFDDRLKEPIVLPTAVPQLLINGTDGIAVGMATKMPPHNLREIVAAAIRLLTRANTSDKRLSEIVVGPDFPTGAIIWGREGIESAYSKGRGRIIVRARAHVEQGARGKPSLVITELPYQVSKQRVIENIAQLARKGQLDGLTDLRDESDRDGVRIVLELKRDTSPRKLLEKLFKKTQLQTTFGVISLALVDGVPRQLNLREALSVWIEHRLEVVIRRARFNLAKAEDRAHTLVGLQKALDDIDRVVTIIRSSRTVETAAKKLRTVLRITAKQADAILAMRLSRLTSLESRKLREELEAVSKRIKTLKSLIADEKKLRDLIKHELISIAERYGDARRTEILDDSKRFPLPTQGAAREVQLLQTHLGYLKAIPARGRQLEGVVAAAENLETRGRDSDFVTRVWLCKSDDQLLAFTPDGYVYSARVSDLPLGTRSSRGWRIEEELDLDEDVVSLQPLRDFSPQRYVITATRCGRVKRTPLSEYANIHSGGIIASGLDDDDEVIGARIGDGTGEIVLCTRNGQAIRFEESEVRPMGRSAAGVKGIDLTKGDEVVAFAMPRSNSNLLAASTHGFLAFSGVEGLKRQARGGKGRLIIPGKLETGYVVGLIDLLPDESVIAVTRSGDMVPLDVSQREGAGGRRVDLGGRILTSIAPAAIRPTRGETGELQMRLEI